jgi:acetyltransferase-like isoleucine patch superfamily enzyme
MFAEVVGEASAIMLWKAVVTILPWRLKRFMLVKGFRYDLHSTSRIGWSWIFPKHLAMGAGARIGHFNVAKGLELISLGNFATIGNFNLISAHALGGVHFKHACERNPALVLGEHAAITSQHYLDCASTILIGSFSTIAGMRSQFLTHGIDLDAPRQDTHGIEIGSYCMVATSAVVLAGSRLPDNSVLSAASLLNKRFDEPYYLYGGVPASPLRKLAEDSGYFHRARGFVE